MMNAPEIRQLFTADAPSAGQESFETLLDPPTFRLERILFKPIRQPRDLWLDQVANEWRATGPASDPHADRDAAADRKINP